MPYPKVSVTTVLFSLGLRRVWPVLAVRLPLTWSTRCSLKTHLHYEEKTDPSSPFTAVTQSWRQLLHRYNIALRLLSHLFSTTPSVEPHPDANSSNSNNNNKNNLLSQDDRTNQY